MSQLDPGAWDLPDPCTIEVTVSPDDVDVLGHSNNTTYIKWCELVAWAHAEALGVGLDVYLELRRAMVITQSEFRYLAPSFEGDRICAATWIVACDGNISVTRQYQIRRVQDGVTLLRGKTHFVCVDMDNGKLRRMPELYREVYGREARDA